MPKSEMDDAGRQPMPDQPTTKSYTVRAHVYQVNLTLNGFTV